MGIKKRVTMTVEVEIDIELSDWANNPFAHVNGMTRMVKKSLSLRSASISCRCWIVRLKERL